MPESWIGWPLRNKDCITPNFYEIQEAHWMIINSCSLLQHDSRFYSSQVILWRSVPRRNRLPIILEWIPIIQKGPDRLRKRASFRFSNLENQIFISLI
jgi:hypothetical protein